MRAGLLYTEGQGGREEVSAMGCEGMDQVRRGNRADHAGQLLEQRSESRVDQVGTVMAACDRSPAGGLTQLEFFFFFFFVT